MLEEEAWVVRGRGPAMAGEWIKRQSIKIPALTGTAKGPHRDDMRK